MPKKKRGEIWWLARGHSSRSRQPSFAPPTARPSVTTSSYGFGWNRKQSCFVTSSNHGMFSRTSLKDYPCDPEVAARILRRCAYKNVRDRFFSKPFAKEDDIDVFEAAGHMFGVSLSKCYWGEGYNRDSQANLFFYAPEGTCQCISLHNGMTPSFARSLVGLNLADIHGQMQ